MNELTLGNGLTSIGASAFNGCSSLSSVLIPTSVTSIGDNAFNNCTSLEELDFNAIECAHFRTYNWRTNSDGSWRDLDTRYLPFVNCPISIVRTGNEVKRIPNYFLYGCKTLKSVNISSSVEEIGTITFANCDSIESITVGAQNTVFDSRSNCNAIISTANNTLIAGCKNTIIPNNIDTIAPFAFWKCVNLKNIKLPNSVKSIGFEAFRHCNSLDTVILGKNIDEMGIFAFDCSSLDAIYNARPRPASINLNVFNSVNKDECYLYVPEGFETVYWANTTWNVFKNIETWNPDANVPAGDANEDGSINVMDYITTASFILERDPQPFNFDAADIDHNGTINVVDLVSVASIALNYEGAPLLAPSIGVDTQASIAMNAAVTTDGQQHMVSINLDNNIDLTALQMDLNLPDGVELVDVELTSRASTSHSVDMEQLENGAYRILASSSASKSFKGNSGAVLTLTLAGETSGTINLSEILVATPMAQGYRLSDITLELGTTGVEVIDTSDFRIGSDNSNIIIDSPSAGVAQIILPNGMSTNVAVNAGHNCFQSPTSGLVIVKFGGKVVKLYFK